MGKDENRLLCKAKHGKCSFRSGKHLVLDGGCRTKNAAKYPDAMAKRLAAELLGVCKRGAVLDLFAGSGVVSKYVVEFGGMALSCDLHRDKRQDLTHLCFYDYFASLILEGCVRSAMIAIPCNSFSLAQSRSGKAIRSKLEPWGVSSDLTESQHSTLRTGNNIVKHVLFLLHLFNHVGLPYIVENPQSSYIWSLPEMKEATADGISIVCHQCAFGSRSRKATRLLFVNFKSG